MPDRRRFIRDAAALGALTLIDPGRLFAARSGTGDGPGPAGFRYAHRILSVSRFEELEKDIAAVKKRNRLSRNPTFQGYVRHFKYAKPDGFPEARTLVMVAVYTPTQIAVFNWKGRRHEIPIPSAYYDDGLTPERLVETVKKEITGDSGCRVEMVRGIFLKRAAARSGLGRYGRNNLIYAEGMGSSLSLYALLTDHRFDGDHWGPVGLLPACEHCVMCYGLCPTGAIRRDDFVIDVPKCIPLYNEIPGEFPRWMRPGMHNALMGCLKCQRPCPENVRAAGALETLEEVTEEETGRILDNRPDEALLESLGRKLKGFYPATSKEYFPVLTRNLGVLLRA